MPDIDQLLWTLYAFAFAFGALWGSFLNVVIYRVPAGLSVVRPASRCPSCETPIAAYDNIPILSWLVLRGRCRHCKTPISIRYPLIELLVAVLAALLAWHVLAGRIDAVVEGSATFDQLLVPWLLLFAYLCALVALFFIDLDITELPPEITIPGILVGVLYGYAVPETGIVADLVPNVSVFDAMLGAVAGGGIVLLLIVVYYLVRGRIGLGFGDVWMMAMVGAFGGWQGLFFIFLMSSLQGILIAIVAVTWGRLRGGDSALFRNAEVDAMERELGLREQPDAEASEATDPADSPHDAAPEPGFGQLAVPFGPFIALAAVEYIFLGEWAMKLLLRGGQL